MLPLTSQQMLRLRRQYAIYGTTSGRINIAGIPAHRIPCLAQGIAAVLDRPEVPRMREPAALPDARGHDSPRQSFASMSHPPSPMAPVDRRSLPGAWPEPGQSHAGPWTSPEGGAALSGDPVYFRVSSAFAPSQGFSSTTREKCSGAPNPRLG